jgi:hypothetical protein
LGDRADKFFDHRLQLKQAVGFIFGRDKKFEVEFMDDVVGDLPREIDRYLSYPVQYEDRSCEMLANVLARSQKYWCILSTCY